MTKFERRLLNAGLFMYKRLSDLGDSAEMGDIEAQRIWHEACYENPESRRMMDNHDGYQAHQRMQEKRDKR